MKIGAILVGASVAVLGTLANNAIASASPVINATSGIVEEGVDNNNLVGQGFTSNTTYAWLFWYTSSCSGQPWNCQSSAYSNLSTDSSGDFSDPFEYCPSYNATWWVYAYDQAEAEWSNSIEVYCEYPPG